MRVNDGARPLVEELVVGKIVKLPVLEFRANVNTDRQLPVCSSGDAHRLLAIFLIEATWEVPRNIAC